MGSVCTQLEYANHEGKIDGDFTMELVLLIDMAGSLCQLLKELRWLNAQSFYIEQIIVYKL